MKSIYFIRSESVLMRKAFDFIDADNRYANQWIDSTDLEDLDPIDGIVFVFDEFNGHEFDCLLQRMAQIISPLVILYMQSKDTNQSIDCVFNINRNPMKMTPIMSQCMNGSFICISIRDKKKKSLLISLIESMSAIYCRRMTSIVTHLITDSIRSKLYEKAFNFDISVMSEEWVLKCWLELQYQLIYGNQESVVSQYTIAFYNRISINKRTVRLANTNKQTGRALDEHNQHLIDEGLDWIDYDSQKDIKRRNDMQTESDLFTQRLFNEFNQRFNQLSERFKRKTNENYEQKAKNSQNHKSLGDRLNSQTYIYWDFNYTEGMASQMSYQSDCNQKQTII